jgi:putative endonuclease
MLAWLKRTWRGSEIPPARDDGRGAAGERLAADFLAARGYAVITRNWRNPSNRREEIDLVCRDRDALVFVEVKTRPDTALVPGFFAVDWRKKRVLRRAFHAYLVRLRHRPATFRFDIVEVVTHAQGPPEVRHYANIALFPKGYHLRQ